MENDLGVVRNAGKKNQPRKLQCDTQTSEDEHAKTYIHKC